MNPMMLVLWRLHGGEVGASWTGSKPQKGTVSYCGRKREKQETTKYNQ
jgi:hypothetical protein